MNTVRREQRAKDIGDADVASLGPGTWTVTSQTNRTRSHQVTISATGCSCVGTACTECLLCSCEDFSFRKRPCKHIFKVNALLLREASQSGTSL